MRLQMGILPFWIFVSWCKAEYINGQAICPEVTQQLLKDGFHRDLLIRVNLGIAVQATENCTMAIKVRLPKGLYVDPYELTSLQEQNVTETLVIADNVDLEVPEYLGTDISVLVYMKPDPECFSCFKAFLPLHCRYHRPVKYVGKISAVLESPEVLIRCQKSFPFVECLKETEIEAPCSQKNLKTCRWNNMNFRAENKELKLQIPVGFRDHLTLLSVKPKKILLLNHQGEVVRLSKCSKPQIEPEEQAYIRFTHQGQTL